MKSQLRELAKNMSDHEKSIHQKAFTTNKKDPNYRTLTTIKYHDGDTEREMKVPAGDVFHQFREDVNNGTLPTVSWLVAPQNYSDHPSAAWYGAWYLSEAFDILTKNPEVWKKTIFILTYDENDGYFDHLPPFTAPDPSDKETGFTSSHIDTGVDYVKGPDQQAQNDHMRDSAIGLGYRVPLVIASPWTRGGWVNSEVFDHTSSIQFLETFLSKKLNKEIKHANVSNWRRTVCGDLTSAFRPYDGEKIKLPKPIAHDEFVEGIHKAQFKNPPSNYKILTPGEIESANKDPFNSAFIPSQERGIRDSNALPYELYANGKLSGDKKSFEVTMRCGNQVLGDHTTGSPFQVYVPGVYKNEPVYVRSYAVASADTLKDKWQLDDFENGNYHLRVYGPNGFYREFKGSTGDPEITVNEQYDKAKGNLLLQLSSTGLQHIEIIDNAYKTKKKELVVSGNASIPVDLSKSYGWYDVSVKIKGNDHFEQRFAGHVETGRPSKTDPYMGRV